MAGTLIALALVAALAVAGARRLRRARAARKTAALPGMSAATAIEISDFDEIAEHVRRLRCPCGGRYELKGESSRESGGRRLRTAGIECVFCEERVRVFFDVTGMFH